MKKIGIVLLFLGWFFLVGSLAFLVSNRKEDREAGKAAQEQLSVLLEQIKERNQQENPSWISPGEEQQILQDLTPLPDETAPTEMAMEEIQVDQNGYIGYLSLPTFELYLPVMSDWTMDKLRISPCHYYGSVGENNLVIMAHNYRHHFGKLVLLNPGDPIYFTNIFGETFLYKVVKREVLPSKSVPQLTSGEYDLTLFTCTFSGENRTAVRCSYVPLEESDQT